MAFAPGGFVVQNWLDDIVASPWVSLTSLPSESATILSFRRFPGDPFGNAGIVHGWRVRGRWRVENTDTPASGDSVDCLTQWAHASQFNTLNLLQWTTSVFDMTQHLEGKPDAIQLSFRTADWHYLTQPFPSPNPGPGPFWDRVRIGRRTITGPVISEGIDARTQAQDAFPTVQDPTIVPGEHFVPDGSNRFGTCALSAGLDLATATPRLVTADSILLDSVLDARGAGGVTSVRFYGAIVAGPHAGKAPAPYVVGANGFFGLDAEPARNASGMVVANRWFVDLDDTYFRGGDVLEYFWAATDAGGGFTSDPEGLAALPASVAAARDATGGLLEASFLPSISWSPAYLARVAADPHGDLAPTPEELADSQQERCILYYQKLHSRRRSGAGNRTVFMYTLDQIDYANAYDVYDVQGYGNTNNQLGGRATVAQASGYAIIIQDDGRSNLTPNLPDGSNSNMQKIDQAGWYRAYLAQGASGVAGIASLWILGENTAFEKATNPLVSVDMGLAGIANAQALAVNPDVAGQAGSVMWSNGITTSFAGDRFALQGGCPAIRAYDTAEPAGTAVATHRYQAGSTVGAAAIVANHDAVLGWNTIWTGFPWFDIYDAGGAPAVPRWELCAKVLHAVVPAGCMRETTEPCDCAHPRPGRTVLGANIPNPFNPTTRIPFDLSSPGQIRLRVFDVAGRHVRTLVDALRDSGRYSEVWTGVDDAGRRVPSGVYFYRLEATGFVATRKMVVTK
jgi:hypothetical protein